MNHIKSYIQKSNENKQRFIYFKESKDFNFLKLSYYSYVSDDEFYFKFFYDKKEIGSCRICKNIQEYKDDLISLGLDEKKINKNYYYLHSIGIKKKWRGNNLGIYFLNKIMEDYHIKGLYLYADKNHPFWNKVSQRIIPKSSLISPYNVFIYKID